MIKLLYRVVYCLCWLAGLLPQWFLYGVVAPLIRFVLHRVVGYRLRVVRENLASSFPEKSAGELRSIERKFYGALSEYFVDAVDIASITPRGLMRRVEWDAENRAELEKVIAGRNWITLMAHYGSWELMNSYGLYPGLAMVSVYRPLHSKVFDLYYYRIRNRLPGLHSVPMKEILRFYMSHRDGLTKGPKDGVRQGRRRVTGGDRQGDGRVMGGDRQGDGRVTASGGGEKFPFGIALVSDQNATLDAQSEWVPFLNHPTVFFHGGEKIGRKFSLPVFYMHVEKRGRGRWRMSFETVWDGISPVADGDITRAYVDILEREIRRVPELWLWSHRRWKKQPAGEALREYEAKYGGE